MAEEDSGNDASTSFVRQRRDLFAVTSIILLARLSHAHFEEVSFQGIGLKLDRPEVLFFGLWVLWGYWLLRYLQAYHEYTTDPVALAFKSAHHKELQRQAMRAGKLAMVPLLKGQILQRIAIEGEGRDAEGLWVDSLAYVDGQGPAGKNRYRPGFGDRLLANLVAGFRVTFMQMTVTDYWFPVTYALTAPIVELWMRLRCS